jgi:hypothetical protein
LSHVGAAENVVISRSLEYSWALQGPVTDPQYSSTLRGCGRSKIELGLVADGDVWLNNEVGAALCTDNSDLGSASLRWANLAPDCDVQNPIIDAAIGAPSGFFDVQNWRYGTGQDGTLTVNGSMAVNNAGQFGSFDGSGLASGDILALNFDARLDREQPPGL